MHKTIVVLPFVYRGSSVDHEFICDGFTDEITNALSAINDLRVISTTTSFSFKNSTLSAKEIANFLSVQIILEGSVQIIASKIRIRVSLIDADADFQLWSSSWNRELGDIFSLQDEISVLVADQLREQLGHLEYSDHLVLPQTQSIDAYTLYLKAKSHFIKWTIEDVEKSIELYEQSLNLDPYYAESYVGLADSHSFLGTTQFRDPIASWKKTQEYTDKALEINPKNAGAHYLLANISFFTRFDYSKAFEQCLTSISYKPNYPEAQRFMAFLYIIKGEMDKAKEHLQVALDIDPLSKETLFFKSFYFFRNGELDKALTATNECLDNNPNNIPAYSVKAYVLLALQKYEECLAFVTAQPDYTVPKVDKLGILCILHYKLENEQKHAELYNELLKEAQKPMAIQAHAMIYLVHAIKGEAEQAFEWVEKSITNNSAVILIVFDGPFATKIRKHEKFRYYFNKIYGATLEQETSYSTKNDLLDESSSSIYLEKLQTYFHEEEPFLKPDFSLRELANELGLNANQMSWLINKKLEKNFNSFINSYRVERFKQIAKLPENAHISLLGLAYESGFNSKTSFNTYFKKETGLTPKMWLAS